MILLNFAECTFETVYERNGKMNVSIDPNQMGLVILYDGLVFLWKLLYIESILYDLHVCPV